MLKSRLETILEQTGAIPLGVYECPVPYKRLLSPALMGWMVGTGRFVYHKDTSCHSASMEKKIAATTGSNLLFMNADTTTALDSLDAGGDGLSPISANFYPELYTYLLTEYRNNGRTETRKPLPRLAHPYGPHHAYLLPLLRQVVPQRTRPPHHHPHPHPYRDDAASGPTSGSRP